MDMREIIAKGTAAQTNEYVFEKEDIPATVVVDGTLGAAETIAVNLVGIDGTSVTPATDALGSTVLLSLTNANLAISAPVRLQFVKGVTAAAVGVFVER